jgi:glucose-6-phosphate isomerase
MPLTLDATNMFAPPVDGGIDAGAWDAARSRFRAVHAAVHARRATGELGFFDLPGDRALLQQTLEFVNGLRRGEHTDVVILGIGGSALGPIALRTALRPYAWNGLSDEGRGGWPRLHVLDNVDPVTIAALLDQLDLTATLFLVVSKSGGTAETMAQYLIVRERLSRSGSQPLTRHLVFVTDPAKGALRPIASSEHLPALDIPPAVGGRFSVLSPVGVLPAALVGIDVQALLAGAADMVSRCESDDPSRNPAAAFALLQWLADTTRGKHMHVLMPYSDPLRDIAPWFVQLWAESLGKKRTDGAHVGPTPIAALGATDQHAQVQLFMEGPANKTVTFIAVRERGTDVTIPTLHRDVADLAYLGGHSLGELIAIEQRATAGALAVRGRPNMTITLDRVDAPSIGALLMMLEIATAYAGELYEINAFDQPGVELGKRFAYALLGRPGFDDAKSEWDALPPSDPARTI